jgi:hypothetical protein
MFLDPLSNLFPSSAAELGADHFEQLYLRPNVPHHLGLTARGLRLLIQIVLSIRKRN